MTPLPSHARSIDNLSVDRLMLDYKIKFHLVHIEYIQLVGPRSGEWFIQQPEQKHSGIINFMQGFNIWAPP